MKAGAAAQAIEVRHIDIHENQARVKAKSQV
jgi:hypothetical protein